ncbi:MAG: hypothetical protein IPM84_14995 [Anaerolineae bacterium]|nr:hypothetical protein [Anaerolineae bacterium]
MMTWLIWTMCGAWPRRLGNRRLTSPLYGRSGGWRSSTQQNWLLPLPATVSPRSLREAGDQRYALAAAGWTPVFLDPEHCWRQPAACLREITQALAQVLDAKE